MILPLHPQPQEGEILSSWMLRLAYANCFKPHTFYAKVLGYKGAIWNRDIDRDPPQKLLEVLGRYTGQQVETLEAMTLRSYVGVLFESISQGNTTWLLPLGIYHRSRRHLGMQFCPVCLQTQKPYYRRCWRLAFYVVCGVHRCLLYDRCPGCSSPIAFHRNGIGRKRALSFDAMYICHGCGFDLRHAQAIPINWPDQLSLERLLRLNSTAELAGWDLGGLSLPCPLSFFSGLRCLVNIVFGRYGGEIRDAVDQALQMPGHTQIDLSYSYEFLGASERLRIMLVLCWLLEDWPMRLLSIGIGRLPAVSQARVDRGSLPFWVERCWLNL